MVGSGCVLALSLLVAATQGHTLWHNPGHRGCTVSSQKYQTRFPNVTWDHELWQLTTTNLEQGRYQSWMTVANGYHGSTVAALGPFFESNEEINGDSINGWPLFERRQTLASIASFWDSQPRTNGSNFPWLYQYGWDSVISGIPHWGGIVLDLGDANILDATTDSATISNFSSMVDMQKGLMNWAFTWTPPGHGSFQVTYQMFAHKVQVNQGFVSMTVTPTVDTNLTFVNVLNGDGALRTVASGKGVEDGWIFSAVRPLGVDHVTAYVYAGLSVHGGLTVANRSAWAAPYVGSNESSIASAVDVAIGTGRTVSVIKYVGIASSDAFSEPRQVAKNAAERGYLTGYSQSRDNHEAEWAALFPRSSVDDFTFPENGTLPHDSHVVETAITAVTNPYYLLQNTVSLNASIAHHNASINDHSISVGGLGSDSYAGQVFWDADIWMHPGLVATFPFAARGITNYRKKLYPQAVLNAQTSYQSSKNNTVFSPNAAAYPWTSGRYGNCTGTGPCFDYQYHLNGDVVLALVSQWLATGDAGFKRDDLFPIADSVATLYSELLERNGSSWALTNMTDPDEYANMVDNGGYTMPLIAETLLTANGLRSYFNNTQNSTWAAQAQNILIGRDEDAGVTLEYTGPQVQNGSIVVKQADVVLVAYPLSYFNQRYTASDALADLEYYTNKQSADGPAMTYAIFSIVANEVSMSGCAAFTYHQYSYLPYVRGPWFQFSEQLLDDASVNGGTHPAFPFLTGHGGAYQVVPYGYLGLRYLDNGHLNVDPAPPPQLPHIRYRTIYWQGWPISAVSNATHTTFSRMVQWSPASGTTPVLNYTDSPIPVLVGPASDPTSLETYLLWPNATLIVMNRRSWRNVTVPNNVAQCRPVPFWHGEFVPGQFPLSAVDGTTSTRWQPLYANTTSSITISLPLGHQVLGFEFDWATQTPYNYSVVFHNSTSPRSKGAILVASDSHVNISHPYNADDALRIRQVVGNTTVVYLNGTMPMPGTNTAPPSCSPSLLYTAAYATLQIWGNQINSTSGLDNMKGEGATVAEWSVIVSQVHGTLADDRSYGYGYVKPRSGISHDRSRSAVSASRVALRFAHKLRRTIVAA